MTLSPIGAKLPAPTMAQTKTTVLVVDDESAICEVLETRLEAWGYAVLLAQDAPTARRLVAAHQPDIVLSDVFLPEANGVELLDAYREGNPGRPVVMMTAYGTIDTAVDAMKKGARDFLTKPLDPAKLKAVLDRLEPEVAFHRAPAPAVGEAGLGALVGTSAPMQALYGMLPRLAATDAPVFVYGESGTGKEVVARTIHALSERASSPLVALNMAALPQGIIESELFGHARGSFTGAVVARPGAFELAAGGTLFLDELAEMPLDLQPKLLRVLEDGTFRPIGAAKEQRADVRIIAATNRDPEQAVAEGRLRADLWYRLNVLTITLPPLRERKDDIPLLARHFLGQLGAAQNTRVEPDALEALVSHDWPGNVRELKNAVQRALVFAQDGHLRREHLPAPLQAVTPPPAAEPLVLPGNLTAAEVERLLVLETLKQHNNNKAAAARQLGVDVKTIRNKLKSWGITGASE